MFIELLDILRCARPHEDSWLVGSFDALVERHILRGTLGCPVCGAEYPVVDGVADFRLPETAAPGALRIEATTAAPGDDRGSGGSQPASGEAAVRPADESEALRLAALLGLSEPGGVVLLMGRWALHAPALEPLAPGIQFLLVNPPSPTFPFASVMRVTQAFPLSATSVRAVAYDGADAGAMTPAATIPVLRQGGRLVAGIGDPVPDGISEMARDARVWVGERESGGASAGPIVRLTRRE